jgi:hypothetical protein
MTPALGTSQSQGRRERRLTSAQRRKAERRAVRERSRNSRLALAGFVALAAAITFGIHTAWMPPFMTTATGTGSTAEAPADTAPRTHAESRIGRLFFNSLDGAICREMQFNNDTGRMSNEKTVRCDEAATREQNEAMPPPTNLRERGFSLRGSR